MCASCFMSWVSPCSGPAGCWPVPSLASRTAGAAIPIPTLKKAQTENRALIFTDEASPRQRRTQECQNPGRGRTLAHPLPLPTGYRLQRFHLPRFPPPPRPSLSPPGSDPDSRQRLLSQGCRSVELVQVQSELAGSAPTATLLARAQPHRAAVAIYPQKRNPRSLFCQRSRVGRHSDPRLRRHAILSRADSASSTAFLLAIMSLYLCADV